MKLVAFIQRMMMGQIQTIYSKGEQMKFKLEAEKHFFNNTDGMTGHWIESELYEKNGRLWVKELTPQTKDGQTLLSIADRYSQDRPLYLYSGSEWEKVGE